MDEGRLIEISRTNRSLIGTEPPSPSHEHRQEGETTHACIARYLALFDAMPEVLSADRVTGADCFFVRRTIAQPADLERVVDALAVDGAVTTSLVLSSPVRKHAAVRAEVAEGDRLRRARRAGPAGRPGAGASASA